MGAEEKRRVGARARVGGKLVVGGHDALQCEGHSPIAQSVERAAVNR